MTLPSSTSVNQITDTKTILILFVEIVIIVIYLISLLLVVIRRAKRLIELRNRKYYLAVAFYIATKLILCSILMMQIIVGIANDWKDLKSEQIELIIKTGLVLADFSIIELFLISLETYFVLCFSAITDVFSRKRTRLLTLALKSLQIMVCIVMVIPLLVFDVNQLDYSILNGMAIGLNSFIVVAFLLTFFYLNFKMTGIMMQARLNNVIKRIYKVQLIILVSRFFIITFQILVAQFIQGTFQNFITQLTENVEYEIILGLLFVGSVLLILFAEGLPIMYSLRSSVVEALNYKSTSFEFKESIFTDNTSGLEDSMIEKREEFQTSKELKLKNFTQVSDVRLDSDESIWICKKGFLDGKEYLIRISKYQISSYIFEDIENEIAMWGHSGLKALSKVSYFCEGEIIHLIEKYYHVGWDVKVQDVTGESELLRIGLELAQAINELHDADIVHGCLTPQHIFFDGSQIVLNGCGLHSLRKYLSLITGYCNKTLYTSTQHLKDRNNVILKPKRSTDVYSFGIILYEIVTQNRQYRHLTLKEIQTKFAEENFRPKLPDQIKGQVKNLIRKCWHQSADRRPTIGEVIDCLKRLL